MIRIPKSKKVLLEESEIRSFAWTWNGIQLKKNGISLTIGFWNPSFTGEKFNIQYLKSGIHCVESRILESSTGIPDPQRGIQNWCGWIGCLSPFLLLLLLLFPPWDIWPRSSFRFGDWILAHVTGMICPLAGKPLAVSFQKKSNPHLVHFLPLYSDRCIRGHNLINEKIAECLRFIHLLFIYLFSYLLIHLFILTQTTPYLLNVALNSMHVLKYMFRRLKLSPWIS